MSLEFQDGKGWETRRKDWKMKQTYGCLYLVFMYSVAGVFSVSTQKNTYETTEDKFVAHEKNRRDHVMRVLCSALSAASNSVDGESATGSDLLMTSDDLDRRLSPNGIRCRLRSHGSSNDVVDDDVNDDDADGETGVHRRRQVDPLNSCIEAKCSSWNSGDYLDCIYRQCISVFQLGQLRSLLLASKRTGRTSATEERLKTSKEDDTGRHLTLGEGSMEEGEDGEGSAGHATETVGRSSSSLEAGLRVMRRGFNDIADVCVQHHCGSFNPHSMNFFSCIESHCSFR